MLQDDDYGELEKAGFSRNMVDNYLAGLQYNAAQDSALNAQQVSQIKTEFGGAEEYDAMTTWAAENMEPDEIAAFSHRARRQRRRTDRLQLLGFTLSTQQAKGVSRSC